MTAPTSTILAYIPSPPEGVWHLGPLPLRAYALCIIVGIIVAVWWGNRRWKARGGQEGEVLDVAIWAVPFGLVGGRLYHVATDWQTYFGDGPKEPIDALKIWDGGLGIWGAVLLGAVGAWIGARRHGIRLPPFGDALAPPILLAQAIGRVGNYFNQELYGRETTVPWGLKIYERVDSDGFADPGLITGTSNGHVVAIVHPTFLYELLWSVLVVILLVIVDRRFRIGHGRLFALYVAGYCVGRFGVELMRSDPATLIFGTRINVFTAVVVFACAAAYFVLAPNGRERGLEIYHPERAEELEELGETGYVDDRYDDDRYGDDPEEYEAAAAGDTGSAGSAAEAALAAAIARHTPHGDDGEPMISETTSDAWVLESEGPSDDSNVDDADGPSEPDVSTVEPAESIAEPTGSTPADSESTPDDTDSAESDAAQTSEVDGEESAEGPDTVTSDTEADSDSDTDSDTDSAESEADIDTDSAESDAAESDAAESADGSDPTDQK
ncbi:prolipoprotein diacylglyceryl transferase [Gordonia insulae]|uniref:Phosphatidylglycerol--prolipoprotein diacylglyceryl transferase n=1 Tax=Gordonia insulae TaxID=2420509 RepID=A0A3G8JGP4_9ACTN|nr:prolipoprotein diacylglyceryl transferase [Gordonia insulae]AZG43775.1 Prolipoprotein diacylglyceryl transferase [Gordonia insulae]